ncbi:hypothetical protein QCA50_006934 [Cerrena zonata]|uniref:Uncharacterized protein n=1 Tax=Cerrena zonata TaxID=2478898 RepID=A0AAW0GKW4_9APHY
MLHRAVPVALPTPMSPASPTSSGHVQAHSMRSRGRGRERGGTTRPPLPFPQSPPGSGYPMVLEIGPPRVEPQLQRSRSQSQGGHSKQESISRPTYVKKRRPSLLGQLIAPLTQNMRKREDEK